MVCTNVEVPSAFVADQVRVMVDSVGHVPEVVTSEKVSVPESVVAFPDGGAADRGVRARLDGRRRVARVCVRTDRQGDHRKYGSILGIRYGHFAG
jgi:hypothetical protein